VFLRTWYPVEVPQFYATVTSLLLPPAEKVAWVGMKTLGQLKRERAVTAPLKEDSLYKVCDVCILNSHGKCVWKYCSKCWNKLQFYGVLRVLILLWYFLRSIKTHIPKIWCLLWEFGSIVRLVGWKFIYCSTLSKFDINIWVIMWTNIL
jgi:hypothetical protein